MVLNKSFTKNCIARRRKFRVFCFVFQIEIEKSRTDFESVD